MTSNPSIATRPRRPFRARASRLAAGLAAIAVVVGSFVVFLTPPAADLIVWFLD